MTRPAQNPPLTEPDAGEPPPGSRARIEGLRKQILLQCEEVSPMLFAWAHLRLRGFAGCGLTAEDVVQETWLRALASVNADEERLSDVRALKAWLIGIAQNVLFEELRRAQGRPRDPGALASPSQSAWLEGFADTVTSICTSLSRHEAVSKLLEFAAGLEDLDRQLLVRCGFEDLNASDVARRLGVAEDTAIKRWQRLRERLRAARIDRRLGLSEC